MDGRRFYHPAPSTRHDGWRCNRIGLRRRIARIVCRGLGLRIAGPVYDDAGGNEGEQHGRQEPVTGRIWRAFGAEPGFESVTVMIEVVGFHWLVHGGLPFMTHEGSGTTRNSPAITPGQTCKVPTRGIPRSSRSPFRSAPVRSIVIPITIDSGAAARRQGRVR